MLHYTIVFLVLGLIAALLGFTGIAGTSIEIAKVLFFVFLILFAAVEALPPPDRARRNSSPTIMTVTTASPPRSCGEAFEKSEPRPWAG